MIRNRLNRLVTRSINKSFKTKKPKIPKLNTRKLGLRMSKLSSKYSNKPGKLNKIRAKQTSNLSNLLLGKKKGSNLQGIKFNSIAPSAEFAKKKKKYTPPPSELKRTRVQKIFYPREKSTIGSPEELANAVMYASIPGYFIRQNYQKKLKEKGQDWKTRQTRRKSRSDKGKKRGKYVTK